MPFQSSASAIMRRALVGMARSSSLGFMDAHYPVAVMSAWFLCRDNDFMDATRDAIADQAEALMGEKAALFEQVDVGKYVSNAAKRIAGALDATVGTYRVGSEGGHGLIFGSMALKALAEFPELFDDEVVAGICGLIAACHTGEALTCDRDDLNRFPGFHEPNSISDVIDNVLWDLNHDVGFRGHIMTHGQALLQLHQLGYREMALNGLRTHSTHVISCQRWKQAQDDLSKWLRSEPAAYSPKSPDYWKHEAAADLWRGGHAFKNCYSFFEIKRAFPNHAGIGEGERSLQWLL